MLSAAGVADADSKAANGLSLQPTPVGALGPEPTPALDAPTDTPVARRPVGAGADADETPARAGLPALRAGISEAAVGAGHENQDPLTAAGHATHLLLWLAESRWEATDPNLFGWREGCPVVHAQAIAAVYAEMCAELGWRPFAWNTVAQHLRRLTGDHKDYFNIKDPRTGQPRKLRGYRISVAARTDTRSARRPVSAGQDAGGDGAAAEIVPLMRAAR